MKRSGSAFILLSFFMLLSSCGSNDTSSDKTVTRTITGVLTGELSAVAGLVVTRTSDGATFNAEFAIPSTRMNQQSEEFIIFEVDLPRSHTYFFDIVTGASSVIANIVFPSGINGGPSRTIHINAGGPQSALDFGIVDIPSGLTANSDPAQIFPENNPLEQIENQVEGDDLFGNEGEGLF